MESAEQLSRRKIQKVSHGDQNEPSDDRLSSLPDPILCHILSFLPTKFSVTTSILARRWKFLWTYVPNIVFNSENHKDGPLLSNIIHRILLMHNLQDMDTFHIFCKNKEEDTEDEDVGEFTEFEIETWIATVIARKVKKLELHLDSLVVLPRCLFTCKTLVDLRLHKCEIRIPLPDNLCFPSLKNLHLCSVKYNGEETLQNLISGCPVLEELVIDQILDDDIFSCVIYSPTIKWLKVNFDLESYAGFSSQNYSLDIGAPSLRYLQLTDYLTQNMSAYMLTSLVEADIHLVEEIEKQIEDVEHHSNIVLGFVNQLSNVECLKLAIDYMEFADSAFSFPNRKFHNLIKLELWAAWRFLSLFLEIADNLEVLVIHKVDDRRHWIEPQQVPICLLSHLTSITFHLFEYSGYDFEMVKYFRMNARVLKTMEIYSSHSHDFSGEEEKWRSWALETISEFERGSEECELVFH